MAEVVDFVDSFDHDQGWLGNKYLHMAETLITHPAGPYHGAGARFPVRGNELGAAQQAAPWDSGAFSANLRVTSAGFTGSGEVALLAPCWWAFAAGDVTDVPHHWLTVDSTGTLRVRRWAVPPAVPPATEVIATSAAGALPLNVWAGLEYRTQIRGTTAGTVQVRVDAVEVLSATGVLTANPQRALVLADYVRFGNLAESTGDTGGVGGLGTGAGSVRVELDDVCQRSDPTAGAALLPWRDVPGAPHRVVSLPPAGPGLYAEYARTGGAATNWQACVVADGFTTYVSRAAVGSEASLPLDLYATTAAPTVYEPGGAALLVWGLAGTDDTAAPYQVTVRARDGAGVETAVLSDQALPIGVLPPWRYHALSLGAPDTVTNARLAGLQIGWGSRSAAEAPLASSMRGTQVCAELWYRVEGEEPEPPPTGGGQRWSVGWVG